MHTRGPVTKDDCVSLTGIKGFTALRQGIEAGPTIQTNFIRPQIKPPFVFLTIPGSESKDDPPDKQQGDEPPGPRKTPKHPGAKTPLRLATKRMDPAVHHHDLQGVLVQLVFRHSPHRAATIGGIRLLGPRDGNILPQTSAPNIGRAGDTRPLFNTGL